MSDITWFDGKYDLQCCGSPVNGAHRVWGCGCIYENDRVYILLDDTLKRTEVIPETLCVKLLKRSEKRVPYCGDNRPLYERIGPL